MSGRRFSVWWRRVLLLSALLAGLALTPAAHAALAWDSKVIEHTAKVGQDLVEVAFTFSNPAGKPVTILDLKPSCGCTLPVLDKRTYAAGEKGKLAVAFDARNLTGPQEKTIQVFTDDSHTPITLTLRITIPPWIEVTPRLIWWSVGEEAKEKEAIVTLESVPNLHIAALKNDSPAMTMTLHPTANPHRFRLTATPTTTTTPTQATATLVLELSGATKRSYVVFVQVR